MVLGRTENICRVKEKLSEMQSAELTRRKTPSSVKPSRVGSPESTFPETQVEALAGYAARASFDDLTAESRKQIPIHILDSIACCLAALGAGPIEACRQQVADFGGTGPCSLIGGGKANPLFAAF